MDRSQRLTAAIVLAAGLATAALATPTAQAQRQPPRASEARAAAFRPPAVPLVASDPYLSVWSMADRLTDDPTRHWTRRPHPLSSLIRVDGKAFRLMGTEPKGVPAMKQVGLEVLPTRSIYDFEDAGIHVTLTFMTPALPDDLDVLARPLTYLTWAVRSTDGAEHAVSILDGASALLTVNNRNQQVEWKREAMGGLTALRVGTVAQTLLQPAGDDTRIDWGYLYLAASSSQAKAAIGAMGDLLASFAEKGTILDSGEPNAPRAAGDREPCLAFAFDLGKVGAEPIARHLMIAYDEIYAIKFLGQKLRPYWRRDGAGPAELLQAAERDYHQLIGRCEAFDRELMADMTKAGGIRYARMSALAYRQALAGCGLAADSNKQPMLFPKENSSNGCVATVDVIYPAAPQFLLMGPTYAKALVAPALVYSTSPRWKFPFAPHDVGTYPQANGQVYGGGEDSKNEADMMPVEESANLILLCAAIARMDGNAEFASRWWPQLTRWEAYLEKYGEDPENQLCTDDFMGHLAHNANLSVKAILAIAAYGELCKMRGDDAAAAKYLMLARQNARHWMKMAGDGDHYRIAFDRPGTWSQKYNLVWDRLLKLNVFPPEVARNEIAYYKQVLQKYGVPLDSRTRLTKADWCLWSATLTDEREDFEAIVNPIYDYLNETTARLPFVDSYVTDNRASDGMRARPVIGGVFIKMLEDPAVLKKWASRDRFPLGDYAPAPKPPRVTELVPTSREKSAAWKYSIRRPGEGWTRADFDDSGWREAPGGFGTRGTPGIRVATSWDTPDIWLRREIQIPAGADPAAVQLFLYHDEDAEIYINGVLAARETGYVTTYQAVEIAEPARRLLRPGAKVVLAVHCHQTGGGQGIDIGLVDVREGE
ncbi:MAG: glutaminase family protein [Isosphaeraceae bacterium]